MSVDINHDRRRFLGSAAMTIAAAKFVMIDSAHAQSSNTEAAGATTIKPGANTSFGSLKRQFLCQEILGQIFTPHHQGRRRTPSASGSSEGLRQSCGRCRPLLIGVSLRRSCELTHAVRKEVRRCLDRERDTRGEQHNEPFPALSKIRVGVSVFLSCYEHSGLLQ